LLLLLLPLLLMTVDDADDAFSIHFFLYNS
jgi:hypothetical protein